MPDAPPRMSIKVRAHDPAGSIVAVYRNTRPAKQERDYIWKIEGTQGKWKGKILAVATEVPLVGEIHTLRGGNPAAVGMLPPHPIVLHNATHYEAIGAWRWNRPTAIVCTSDGEVWAVHGSR